ncbi:MAG: hypothetical protein AAF382_00760 [Pseudomonadota bacterium]
MNWVNWIAFALNALVIALWVATARAETAVSCEPLGAADSIDISPSAATQEECGTYLDQAGRDAQVCQWQFTYRSDEAKHAFEASETAFDGCFNKTFPEGSDVNHPDSYDQVFYTTETALISLALKDKAQSNATYLFLRIETAP